MLLLVPKNEDAHHCAFRRGFWTTYHVLEIAKRQSSQRKLARVVFNFRV